MSAPRQGIAAGSGRSRNPRRGFSLLEVLLATSVLLGCVIVLSHIAFVGRAHMESAEELSAAQLACQSRMNEMLVGSTPIQAVVGEPIAGLPGWALSVKIESAARSGLMALEVTAFEAPTGIEAATERGGKQFTLVRWIAEPRSSRSARPGQAALPTMPPDWNLPGSEDFPPLPGAPDLPYPPGESGLPAPLPDLPLPPEGPLFPDLPGATPLPFDEP